MNQVKINLACGFEKTFGRLKSVEKKIKCAICEDEELIVESVLNLPANRLSLKEKEIELDFEYLNKLESEISTIKHLVTMCYIFGLTLYTI